MERAALAAFLFALALGCAAALAADAVDLTQPVANGAQISGPKEQKDHTAPIAQDAPGLKKTLAGPTLESGQGLPARPASPGTASLLRLGLGLVVVLALLFGLMVRDCHEIVRSLLVDFRRRQVLIPGKDRLLADALHHGTNLTVDCIHER